MIKAVKIILLLIAVFVVASIAFFSFEKHRVTSKVAQVNGSIRTQPIQDLLRSGFGFASVWASTSHGKKCVWIASFSGGRYMDQVSQQFVTDPPELLTQAFKNNCRNVDLLFFGGKGLTGFLRASMTFEVDETGKAVSDPRTRIYD